MHTKHLCLGALSLQDGTGYDIKKLFESAFSHFQNASYGSIYPSLKKLEEDGSVNCHIEPGDKHPDRKLFRITEQGKKRFIEELVNAPASEVIRSDFLVLMFFAHLLPTAVLEKKLEEIGEHYRQELNYLESIKDNCGMSAGMRYGVDQGIAVYKTKIKHLEQRSDHLLHNHQTPPQDCEG